MTTKARDNFTESTRRALAIRAAHHCSNPRCLKLTAGPHSDNEKGLQTGHAAHICAAAAGGPRYDEEQTPAQRRAAANGIWMCRECGVIVDTDPASYTVLQLRQMKADHEAMIGEIRTEGWSSSIELLRSGRADPAFAERIIALFEDRSVFWAAFDAEFPDRVRRSLDGLRRDLTALRGERVAGSPLDQVLVALGSTIRHFFGAVTHLDMDTLRCDGNDPEWLSFESALRTLRKAIGFQLAALGSSYGILLQGEFAEYQAALAKSEESPAA